MDIGNLPNSEQSFEQSPKAKRKYGFNRLINNLMLFLAVGLIFSCYWLFFNKYAVGDRTGVLIKISHKGNFFKTDEGEMWLSCRIMTNPEKFYFSVESDSLAKRLTSLQDECVQLRYSQYRGELPWRGKTKYIVTGVTAITKN